MDESIVVAEDLKQSWRELIIETQKTKKLKLEVFNETFTKTYSLLSTHSNETSLDKKYIELIAEAFLFANIKDEALDNKCLAAFVLTERMLSCYAFGSASAMVEPSTIYLVEARRDLILNFNDVNETISKLTKVFEEMYWKNLN